MLTIKILVETILVEIWELIWQTEAMANKKKSDATKPSTFSSGVVWNLIVKAIKMVHAITNEITQIQAKPVKVNIKIFDTYDIGGARIINIKAVADTADRNSR